MIKKLNEQGGSDQSTLAYYRDKVDTLNQQRLAWLSKYDECSLKLQQKHKKQEKLKKLKDSTADTIRSITHQQIALFDERTHAININKQKKLLQFEDAQQILKIKQLSQQFPNIIQKQVPCNNILFTDQVIQNDLNIHSSGGRYKKIPKEKYNIKINKGEDEKKIISKIPTFESLLKQQIIQVKSLNDQQQKVMQQQIETLQNMIKQIKINQKQKIQKQREVVNEFNKKYKQLQKKHKKLAQTYFQNRRKQKKQFQITQNQNQILKKTQNNLQQKIQQQLKKYQKQNKAKQTLIIKRNQDFQQDYKAKMRAKQHNLQALKENYQKMQEICIVKVRKLQTVLEKAKNMLKDAQQSRNFTVQGLRQQLKILQKRVGEQRIQKAKLDIKAKQKIQQKRIKQQLQRQKMQKTRKMEEKNKKILTAYRNQAQKTRKGMRKSKQKDKFSRQEVQNDEEESLDMSDLDNIKQKINELQQKISKSDKHYS